MSVERFTMETVSRYTPLTPGRNTIRKFSPKYHNMEPGDTLLMHYVDEDGKTHGREKLIVRSIHVAHLDTLCLAHYRDNHGFHMQAPNVLRDFLLKCYPGTDTQEDTFIAIYV